MDIRKTVEEGNYTDLLLLLMMRKSMQTEDLTRVRCQLYPKIPPLPQNSTACLEIAVPITPAITSSTPFSTRLTGYPFPLFSLES